MTDQTTPAGSATVTITPSSYVPPCEVWIVQGGAVISKLTVPSQKETQ